MKRMYIFAALGLIISFGPAYAHKERVHQYLTREAYLHLQSQKQLSPLYDSFFQFNGVYGAPTHESICLTVDGSYVEDARDIVFGYCGFTYPFGPCANASSSHFWDPDNVDPSAQTHLEFVDDDFQNALVKAKKLWRPDQDIVMPGPWNFQIYDLERGVLEAEHISTGSTYAAMIIGYESLPKMFKTHTYSFRGVVTVRGIAVYFSHPYEITYSTGYFADFFAANILGRIAHLLEDMNIPAHVKSVAHPCEIGRGSRYELVMGNGTCSGPDQTFQAQVITHSSVSGLMNPFQFRDPMKALFYMTAQLTDCYSEWRQNGIYYDVFSGDQTYASIDPITGDNYQTVVPYIQAIPSSFANYEAQANHEANNTQKFTMMAVASLFYWFGLEAGAIPPEIYVKNDFNSDYVSVNSTWYPSGTLFTNFQLGSVMTLSNNATSTFGGYTRHFAKWQKLLGSEELASSTNLTWAVAIDGSHTYQAQFNKEYNVTIDTARYVEPGGGGMYRINQASVTSSWQGTYTEHVSDPIEVEAVPPNSQWFFDRWSDGVTQNPYYYCPGDHSILYAIFKKRLSSTTPTASGRNNQRKLESFGATEYAVYPSAGSIYFTKNDGSGWSNETRLSFMGTAKNPSIAETYSAPYTVLHVVWEEIQWWSGNEYHNVFYRKSTNNGASWQNAVQVSYPPGYNAPPSAVNTDAAPVVAGSPIVIVWKAGDIYSGSLKIQVEPVFGSSTYFTVDGSNGASSSASLRPMQQGPYKVAYRDGSATIQYREFNVTGGYPYYSVAFDFGKSADLSSEYWWMSDAANPCIVFDGTRTFVTWDALCEVHAEEEWKDGSMGVGAAQRHILAREFTTSWQPVVEFAHYNYPLEKPSVGVNMNTSKVVVMWELNGNSVDKVARDVTGGSWGVVSLLDGGVAPNLNHYVYGGNPTYAMYTAGSSAPYSIVMNTNVGMNPLSSSLSEGEEDGEIKDAPQGSFQLSRRGSIDLGKLRLGRLPAGSVQGTLWIESSLLQIERGSASQPWPFLSDTSDFSEWLSTTSVVMPQDADAVIGTLRISMRNFRIADTRVPLTTRLFSSDLLTVKGSENSRHFTLGDLVALGTPDTSISFKTNVAVHGLRGKQLRMRIRLVGQDDEQEPRWSTFLAVDSTASSSFKTSSALSATSMLRQIPVVYDLHANYPNPFNPSTTIKFDLPEISNVSLVVYDVLGRRVAELANGAREAGYHSVAWNASDIASGMYFARFEATDAKGNIRLNKVSKLLLTK